MTNTETIINALIATVRAAFANSAAAERGWPAPTVEHRPVAAGVRVEVTHHMPHRPASITAYLIRPGDVAATEIATINLCQVRPQWRNVAA